jgi:hypothetical protein
MVRSSGFGLRKLLISRRASIAVEAAMAAPFLLMLVIGVVDIARAGMFKYQLRQAAQQGTILAGASGSDAIARSAAAAAAGVPAELVNVSRWLECDGARAAPGSRCGAGQQSASFVEVEVSGGYQPTFSGPLLSPGPNGSDIMLAGSAIRQIS